MLIGKAIPTAVTTRGCGIHPGFIHPTIPGMIPGTILLGAMDGTIPGIMITVGDGIIPITTILTMAVTTEATMAVTITAPAITERATLVH